MDFAAETPRRRGFKKKHCFPPRLRASAVNITAVSGFTYVMVLAAVVVVGILAQAAVPLSSHIAQADREAELLFRGQTYRNAIKSYYEAGKPIKAFPRALEDLLDDPRFPRIRHLRALYPDPMARDGKGEWTLVRAADGGISGVVSASGEEPLKQANFPPGLENFAGAKAYSEWIFEYRPTVTPPIPAPALRKTF